MCLLAEPDWWSKDCLIFNKKEKKRKEKVVLLHANFYAPMQLTAKCPEYFFVIRNYNIMGMPLENILLFGGVNLP